jgi:leucyl-tRNA synthetase
MSKSLKNVVNPDDIISEFGADTLRMYEMYLADFKDAAPWDTKAIVGVKRFLDRVWNNVTGEQTKFAKDDAEAIKEMHKAIKKVGEDIESYKFNTAISAMMIMLNA